jgi:segregation and condensation protein A
MAPVTKAQSEMNDTVIEDQTAGNENTRPAPTGSQAEMSFAVVEGKPISQIPLDLYIPPDALEVILEAFEGPLDLLLYLIRRQNLDILNISVAEITRQYMQYIELMQVIQFELAAEYLVMAAVLAEIKSRMLLPCQSSDEEEEQDPRAELIRRLQEYERFKQAAMDLDNLDRLNRDFWIAKASAPQMSREKPLPDVKLQEMLVVLSTVMRRAERFGHHHIQLEPLSTRERMSQILERVSGSGDRFIPFVALFTAQEGKLGVIVTFVAVLELLRENLVEVVQSDSFAPIHVKAAA